MSHQVHFSQSEKQENNVAVALGSNLGDSLSILENAIQILSKTPGITLNTYSSWYRTKPIGPKQPDYLNGCALLKVELTPQNC
ncbi:hypothetical protein CYANOKiyG1_52700 [Okeania sp. KiyG1]|nr:2-amino-4-hydroxy-6-hydroxymethyldihydropteridine diphosphokinase [Okeania sp. KiyG1]GGA35144.1 hypothetical protein CYANOKiyG1_52700 [Okeania sp. KiyG1]